MKSVTDTATMNIITEYTGGEADNQRSYFASNNLESIQKSYLNFQNELYPDIKRKSSVAFQDNREENIFTTTEKYTIPHFWKPESEGSARLYANLEALWLESYFNVTKSKVRTSPYSLRFPLNFQQHLIVRMPYAPAVQSDSRTITTDFYQYSYSLNAMGDEVHMDTGYKTMKDAVPSSEIGRFVDDHQVMRQKLSYYLYANENIVAGRTSPHRTANQNLIYISMAISGIAGVACFIFYRNYDPEPALFRYNGTPIAGSVLLVLLGFGFLTLIAIVDFYVDDYNFSNEKWDKLSAGPMQWPYITAVIDLIFGSVFTAVTLLIVVLAHQRRSALPRTIILYFAVSSFFMLLDVIAQNLAGTSEHLPGAEVLTVVLYSCLFIPYFMISTRVKETFVRRTGRMPMRS